MSDDLETESTTAGSAPERPARKLYPKDWLEIISLAKEGVPVEKIAKTFGVQKSTVYRGLKKRKIRLGAYTASAEEVVEDENRKILIERIRKTKDDGFRFTEHLEKEALRLAIEARRDGVPYAQIEDSIRTLERIMKLIRHGTENKWKILGLDRENENTDVELPELPLRELTEDEVAAIRDKQILEDLDDQDLDPDEIAIEGEDEGDGDE